jgi:hypothetical protein
MISRGAQIERIARKVIESGKGDIITAQRQLAHALHLQGRYAEAVEVAPDEVTKNCYAEIQAAIDIDDELCACPRKEVDDPLTGKKLSISPRRHLKDVYSPRHGEVVALMSCENGCPLNARPLTGQAREIANNVRMAHQTVADTRRRALTDTQVLKEQS